MEEGRVNILSIVPRAKFEASKCLIYPEKWTFWTLQGVRFLIHNLAGVTLWTSPIFLSGSSALAIGYFLRNFLVSFPALACSHASSDDGVRVL
jgi:hypothetical protein